MLKRTLTTFLLSLSALIVSAEEGMWLPSVIGTARLADMRSKGFRLTAKDLYDINNASLKDAVVHLGGCTGEVISDEGLMLTNHHCGYGNIQKHSTVEHDYLTDGFWAMSRDEELPNPGYTASFLKYMEDVTEQVNKGVKSKMTDEQAAAKRRENINKIIAEATDGNGYRATVESLYYGNQYFLFVYETFRDVRLVGCPPSAIGKFGGDTDNWMWPRHTGDFCLFRIYADKDNKPADYSKDNVPYRPKRSFAISTKGVAEGDFTFIYGYPGRTYEYITSDAVRYIADKSNPAKIALRTARLDIMNRHQAADPAVRIKYAAKNASVSNAWKKWQGETKGVVRLDVVSQKEALERSFAEWAADKPEYTGLTDRLHSLYVELEPYAFAYDYYNESVRTIELLRFGGQLASAPDDRMMAVAKAFYKDYHRPIDEEIAKAVTRSFVENVDPDFRTADMETASKDVSRWVDSIFDASVLTDSMAVYALIEKDPSEARKVFADDAATKVYAATTKLLNDKILPRYSDLNKSITALYGDYMRGLMEFQPERPFYPDANSTLRIAYGKVGGFAPRDGVVYDCVSTIDGIMEKDNPEIYDYNVPQRLRDIYKAKDYGRWAVNGTVPVAFIASNHTTGGNSGSPVINGDGELIGLNFDRCWESTMSDIVFDEEYCRNIAVDIRYVLFLIDKFAGAGYLLEEMNLR